MKGNYIRRVREKRGLSQHQLAEMAQIGRTQLSAYELDKHVPSLLNAVYIAKALGITVDDLTDGLGMKL